MPSAVQGSFFVAANEGAAKRTRIRNELRVAEYKFLCMFRIYQTLIALSMLIQHTSGPSIERGLRACLKTANPIKIRHSRESGNPVFSRGSGSPGQAGG